MAAIDIAARTWSSVMEKIEVGRRSFLKTAGAVVGVEALAGLPSANAAAASAGIPENVTTGGPAVVALDNEGVVDTIYGKVRGSRRNGIHIFRGISYGANTGGETRFMPARAPKSWAGIRSTLWYGRTCPAFWRPGSDEPMFIYQNDLGYMDEDCLVANVWTPGINDNKKRPVMVWVHGGGYSFGSCQELKSYEGEMLARDGDVVVVSFNHRLNALGFLNLSEFGGDYATSGNVGMTDIVFLLKWVRDNIGTFGGDPGNVMIMGQSGGGGKVGTLMAMPSAQGLFHRASIHSGSILRVGDPELSLGLTHALLSELEIPRTNLDKLRTLAWQEIVNAAGDVQRRHRSALSHRPVLDARNLDRTIGWGPYMDGTEIPHQVWDPAAPEISADVPLMVGTVLNEFLTGIGQPDAFSLTKDGLMKQLNDQYGANAQELYDAFSKNHPTVNPFQLLSIISACSFRSTAIKQAQLKAAQGKAPAYNFWMQWQSPTLSGRAMAFHCFDLCFFFNNSERCDNATGNGEAAKRLARQMSQAWIRFARTGNPNHAAIPKWEPVTANGSETMIFDMESRFNIDPDSAERAAYSKTIPA
jgi:para-nitrobenzyl esterase